MGTSWALAQGHGWRLVLAMLTLWAGGLAPVVQPVGAESVKPLAAGRMAVTHLGDREGERLATEPIAPLSDVIVPEVDFSQDVWLFNYASQQATVSHNGGSSSAYTVPFTERVRAVAAVPGAPNNAYYLTLGGVVWKTTNGGQSYSQLNNFILPATYIPYDIVADPMNPNTVYVAWAHDGVVVPTTSSSGVYSSIDGGITWTPGATITNGMRRVNQAFMNTQGTLIMGGTGSQCGGGYDANLWRSTNGGRSWAKTWVTCGLFADVTGIANSRRNPNVWYASIYGSLGASSIHEGILRSTDDGRSWQYNIITPLSNTANAQEVSGIAVDNFDPNLVLALVKDYGVYRSPDGGLTWANVLSATTANFSWQVRADPKYAGVFWLASTTGLSRSINGGETWTPVLSGAFADSTNTGLPARSALALTPPRPPLSWRSFASVGSKKNPQGTQGEARGSAISNCDCETQGLAGDPIDTRSGDFSYGETDLSFPTLAGPLAFERHYNSQFGTEAYTATLGYGWTHNQDTRLIFADQPGGQPGMVWFKAHSANQYLFYDDGHGNNYTASPGVLAALTPVTTTYVLTASDQSVYRFNSLGRVTQWRNAQGYGFNYGYDGQGRLTAITEPVSGRYLAFTYYVTPSISNTIQSVRDRAGRVVTYTYTYTTSGGVTLIDLVKVTDVLRQDWTYSYTVPLSAPITSTVRLLTRVTDPRGRPVVRTDYDAQGRAWRQYEGASTIPTVQVAYLPGGTTVVTDARQISSTHFYGGDNTLGNTVAPLGSAITKTYDNNFRPATVLDPLSHPTTLTWSANGVNLTETVNALGQATQMGYDTQNNLTQTVDARGLTTTFAYSGTLLTIVTDTLKTPTYYTYTNASDSVPVGLLKATSDAKGRTTRYQYDPIGQRIALTDTAGIVTRWGYDDLGRVVTTTTNAGTARQQITVNTYDAAGRVISTTRNYLAGQPQNYVSVSGNSVYNIITRYQFDELGHTVRVTDTLGHVTRTEYDDNGRPVTVTVNFSLTANGPDWNIKSVTAYDAAGNVISTTQNYDTPLARTTVTQYDALNRPVTVTQNYTGTGVTPYLDWNIKTVTAYDPAGNVISSTQFYGTQQARTTYTDYDRLNRPVTVTTNYAPGQTGPDKNIQTVTGYDPNGNVVTTTQYAGSSLEQVTVTGYDELNRPVTMTSNFDNGVFDENVPDKDLISLTAYDSTGRVISTTERYGSNLARTTYTEYDNAGRPVTVTANYDGNGVAAPDRNLMQVTIYGPAGERQGTAERRVLPGSVPIWITTTYRYNNLGQLITTTAMLTNGVVAVTTQQYDALGRTVESTDALGMKTHTDYDALGRAVTVTANYTTAVLSNPWNLRTTTIYNAAGQRERVTDARNNPTQFQYDAVGRLITVIDARSGVTRYAYDVAGNLITLTDARTHTTTYTYDLLGRQLSETDPLLHTWRSAYNVAGDRTVITDALGQVTTFTYNANHQLRFTDYPGSTPDVVFEYDALGRTKVMTDGVGPGVTTWAYDLASRPLTITYPLTGPVSYAYDSAGNRLQLTYPGGKVVNYAYDFADRLLAVWDWNGQTTAYTYNALGQPLTTTLPNGVTTLNGYDSAHRLSTLTHRTSNQILASYVYTLDAVGNRTGVLENLQNPAQPISYTAPTNPQYLPLVFRLSGPPTITYVYDDANRLSSVNGQPYIWNDNGNLTNDGTTTYVYDVANRLITATTSGTVYGFDYNGFGQRVRQSWNPGPGTFYLTYTLDMNGQVLAEAGPLGVAAYVYGRGPVAQVGATADYFLADGFGSVRQMVSVTGSVVLRRDYDPFGNVLTSTGAAVSPYDFAGLWRDNTGLFYIGSGVYYDPLTGRYLTRGGGGLNPYIPINPLGAFIAPLMAWLLWRRRKGGKYSKVDQIMFVLVLLVGVGGGLAACDGPAPQPTRTLPPPIVRTQAPTQTATLNPPTRTANATPTLPATPTQTPTVTPCPEPSSTSIARPPNILDNTWNQYMTIKTQAPNLIEPDGTIEDQAFLAMIIFAEFNVEAGNASVFGELKEGLSRQYYGYGCDSDCSTLEEQLNWADNMQGWGIFDVVNNYQGYLGDAKDVKGNGSPYLYGEALDAWWWGNYDWEDKPSLMGDYFRSGEDPILAFWWKGAGKPYLAHDPDHKLVVLTWDQNISCGDKTVRDRNSGKNCLGF